MFFTRLGGAHSLVHYQIGGSTNTSYLTEYLLCIILVRDAFYSFYVAVDQTNWLTQREIQVLLATRYTMNLNVCTAYTCTLGTQSIHLDLDLPQSLFRVWSSSAHQESHFPRVSPLGLHDTSSRIIEWCSPKRASKPRICSLAARDS